MRFIRLPHRYLKLSDHFTCHLVNLVPLSNVVQLTLQLLILKSNYEECKWLSQPVTAPMMKLLGQEEWGPVVPAQCVLGPELQLRFKLLAFMKLNNPTEPHNIQLEKGNADHLIGPFSHLAVHHPRLELMPVTGSQVLVSPHSF